MSFNRLLENGDERLLESLDIRLLESLAGVSAFTLIDAQPGQPRWLTSPSVRWVTEPSQVRWSARGHRIV